MDSNLCINAGSIPLQQRGWRAVFEPLLSVLFPPRCVGCGEFEVYLCNSCRGQLRSTGLESCPRCGEPGEKKQVGGRCSVCMDKELQFSGNHSAFIHQGVAKKLVASFKFGGQPVLGHIMANLARPAFLELVDSLGGPEKVLATWVPSHKAKKRERGYNQAEILARHLSEELPGLCCRELVVKTRDTKHQKGLGMVDRQNNLRDAFAIAPFVMAQVMGMQPHLVQPAKETRAFGERGIAAFATPIQTTSAQAIILIDDVHTTGATISAVSAVLTAQIGLPVYAFTFSRAVSANKEGHD